MGISFAELMASWSILGSPELMHNKAYMDLYSFRYAADDIFILMKSPDSNNGTA